MARIVTFLNSDFTADEVNTGVYTVRVHTDTSLTSLTNDTAYRAFVLDNPSASFTPTAPSSSITATFLTEVTPKSSGASGVLTYSAVDLSGAAEGDFLVVIAYLRDASNRIASGTIGGAGMILQRAAPVAGDTTGQNCIAYFTTTRPASATPDIVITSDLAVGIDDEAIAVYKLSAAPTGNVSSGGVTTTLDTISLNLTTYTGGVVFAAAGNDAAARTLSITGVGNQRTVSLTVNTSARFIHGFTNVVTGEVPATISADLAEGTGNFTAAAISFEA